MMTASRSLRFRSQTKFLFLSVLTCVTLLSPSKAATEAGQLDKTFGRSGIFLGQNAGFSTSFATALAIQGDGKILIAGQTPLQEAGVFRLTAIGALDTSFGTGGFAAIPHSANLGAVGFLATGVIVQSDRKIVLAISGFSADAAPRFQLARFNANGTVDTSFGENGIVLLLRGGPDSAVLTQQPNGNLLIGGGSLLARTDANGNLDATFGTGGFAPLINSVATIAFETGGQLVLGTSRYDANGTLDTSFGIAGRAPTIESISVSRLQSDGKIVGIGSLPVKVSLGQLPAINTVTGFGVMRFTTSGGIDASFGQNGAATSDFSSFAPTTLAFDVAIQSDGHIIVAGQATQPAASGSIPDAAAFAIARYTSTGQLDAAFGSGGKVITSFGANQTAGIAAVALDSAGRLVAVGNLSSGGNPGNIVVARYLTQ